MPDYATNIKADQNVFCWVCDHFQRYARPGESICAGECRLKPPIGRTNGEMPVATPYENSFSWPVIQKAEIFWCGRFQKSREKNLPDKPGQCVVLPINEYWSNFWEVEGPWNKKTQTGYVDDPQDGVMCLTCDHFNATDDIDSSPNSYGQCRANPGPPHLYIAQNAILGEASGRPWMIQNAVCSWCAQYERSSHGHGADPATWDCPQNPEE